jgi:hypothetical protein
MDFEEESKFLFSLGKEHKEQKELIKKQQSIIDQLQFQLVQLQMNVLKTTTTDELEHKSNCGSVEATLEWGYRLWILGSTIDSKRILSRAAQRTLQLRSTDCNAQYSLGLMNQYGLGIHINSDCAMGWFILSAFQANKHAQKLLHNNDFNQMVFLKSCFFIIVEVLRPVDEKRGKKGLVESTVLNLLEQMDQFGKEWDFGIERFCLGIAATLQPTNSCLVRNDYKLFLKGELLVLSFRFLYKTLFDCPQSELLESCRDFLQLLTLDSNDSQSVIKAAEETKEKILLSRKVDLLQQHLVEFLISNTASRNTANDDDILFSDTPLFQIFKDIISPLCHTIFLLFLICQVFGIKMVHSLLEDSFDPSIHHVFASVHGEEKIVLYSEFLGFRGNGIRIVESVVTD